MSEHLAKRPALAARFIEPPTTGKSAITMAKRFALAGKSRSRLQHEGDWTPYCDSPVVVSRANDPRNIGPSVEVSFLAPCRQCTRCLEFRRMQWLERMEAETLRAPRTWMVTLTFDPILLAGILAKAAQSKYWPHKSEKAIDQAAYWHLQLWLKRLRKAGHKVRYFAAFERGEETGRPHYHALVHEVDRPVSYRVLTHNWPSQVHAKLVDPGASARTLRYVSKYLTKSLETRPRASQKYGTDFLLKK